MSHRGTDRTDRRRRLRRRRADRGVRRLAHRARHPLRGRRPARRPRRHPPGADCPTASWRIDTGFIVHNRAHLPHAAAALRRARRRDPALGDVAVDQRRRAPAWSTPARSVARGLFPTRPTCAAALTGGCSPRSRASTAGPGRCVARAGPTGLRDGRPDAARVPRRRSVLAALRAALHGAAGRRRLVVRPRDVARLPRALPVHLPRAPRHARHLRLAAVAHRHRRLAARTSPRSPPDCPRCASAPRSPRCVETADGVEVTDGNGAVTRLRRRRHRHPPRPGAGDAGRADRRSSARCCGDALLAQHRAAAHRHLAAARAPRRAGVAGTSAARRRQPPAHGHGHLRPHPAAAARHRHPLPRHPRRRAPRRPGHRDRPDGVRAPALHPGLGRRPAPAARDRHRPRRLRRRLPRLGLPRGRRALGPRRRHPPRAAPGRRDRHARPARRAGSASTTTIRHTRRTPFQRTLHAPLAHSGSSTSTTCPTTALLGPLRGARPPRRRRTARIRANVEAFLAGHGVDARRRPRDPDGRQPALARLLLQPDLRLLVLRRRRRARPRSWSRCTTPTATGTPTSSTPTSRAARRTDKAMYVSPFHGVDGTYDLAVPAAGRPARTSRSPCAPTTATDGRPRFSASLTGTPQRHHPLAHAPGAALRGSAAHPRARHLAVAAPTSAVRTADPTTTRRVCDDHRARPAARPGHHRAGSRPSTPCPPARAPPSRRAVARRLFRAAVGRLDVTVVEEPTGRTLGRGGPRMRDPPPRRVLRPARPRRPDRLRRGLPHRRLGRRRPGRLPHRPGGADRHAGPGRPAAAAGPRRPPHAGPPAQHRGNSQANIAHHYDLSNDLFELFLDQTLSYSSALFDTSVTAQADERPAPGRDPAGARRPAGRPRPQPRPRRGAGPQDRAAARPGRRRRGHPRARDRHRVGASSPSAPPAVARPSTPSPCRSSSRSSPSSGSPQRGLRRPGAGRAAATTATSAPTGRPTTPCCRSR